MTERADTRSAAATAGRGPRLRAGAVIAIALLAGFIVWLVLRDDGSSSTSVSTPVAPRADAVPVSRSGLQTLARAVGRPIYWAGPMRGFTYELTKTSDDRVYIRYLPAGVAVGTSKPYLTIGTYPVQNAFAATTATSRQSDSVRMNIAEGGIAFYTEDSPANVYFAYPGSDYQIEVYDPSPERAQELVASGKVRPVPGAASSGASRASPAELKALATSLGHPLYWIGEEPGMKYEVRRASGGSMYLRYLPRGVRIGVEEPHLTIGTYPMPNAFSVTERLSRKPSAVPIEIGSDGIAFYSESRPTNVYVAYQGVDVQIEVYDPSANRAHDLVASKLLLPVN
jgi:hypothetical protein